MEKKNLINLLTTLLGCGMQGRPKQACQALRAASGLPEADWQRSRTQLMNLLLVENKGDTALKSQSGLAGVACRACPSKDASYHNGKNMQM
eukprot:863952-Pelagomonas_calceolata.AAC.1